MLQKVITPHGEVSYVPKRGGIITSLIIKNKEILSFSYSDFENMANPVRGGIPILFPNAGELTSSVFPLLNRHGFARDMAWRGDNTGNGFLETLESNEQTKKIFPFDFKLTVSGEFNSDGTFTISQSVINKERDVSMPLSMGLHPYFKVPAEEKKNIKFNFKGGEEIESEIDVWASGGTVIISNPNTPLEVIIPTVGTLVLNYSSEYKKIWIWSEEGKDFVCIEPIMREPGGLTDDPQMVQPGESFEGKITIGLK